MDSLLSFPVGLFHPLQHAGLSRRSPIYRQSLIDPGGIMKSDLVRLIALAILWAVCNSNHARETGERGNESTREYG